MAEFELSINNRAYEAKGVAVDFNEEVYAGLLDSLVDEHLIKRTPAVSMRPAPVWGMSGRERFLASMAHDQSIYPYQKYRQMPDELELVTSQDQEAANRDLLSGTLDWAAACHGELGAHYELRKRRTKMSLGLMAIAGGVGGAVGYEVAGEPGALFGATVCIMGGMVNTIRETECATPHAREIAEFIADPQNQAAYGEIITYQPL